MNSFSGSEFYVYSGNSLVRGDAAVNRLLMKRYFLIEKTKVEILPHRENYGRDASAKRKLW